MNKLTCGFVFLIASICIGLPAIGDAQSGSNVKKETSVKTESKVDNKASSAGAKDVGYDVKRQKNKGIADPPAIPRSMSK